MVEFIQPLDLEQIFVNAFAGSLEVFIFVTFILIAALAARFRMPNLITLVMFSLFGIFLSAYISGVYAFIVIIAGIVVFYSIGRIIKF